MPKLNNSQKLIVFFEIGAILGVIAPWGAVGIFLTMLLFEVVGW